MGFYFIVRKIFSLLFTCVLFLLNANAQPTSQTFNTNGAYVVPNGYAAIVTVELWGGGGSGGNGTNISSSARTGGGGGAYTRYIGLRLTGGSYTVTVGTGGVAQDLNAASPLSNGTISSFEVLTANGGTSTYGGGIGIGGAASVIPSGLVAGNYISYAGGSGGARDALNNTNSGGGGGGGSAGPSGVGVVGGNGSQITGGTGGTGSGAGGNGGTASILFGTGGFAGFIPGGGGGGKGYGTGLSGNGAGGRVIITVTQVLPVSFGVLEASESYQKLQVHFTTLTENNNDYFNIQISSDGHQFKNVATLKSKHKGETFSGITNYSISIDYNQPVASASLLIFVMAVMGFGYTKKRTIKRWVPVISIFMAGIIFLSCNTKNDFVVQHKEKDIYIRIQQVDIDGISSYSRIIKAIKD
ncbi:MAG: hypothetical protein ACK5NK_05855 [Niabella sp.]